LTRGVQFNSTGTLLDKTVNFLESGPADCELIATEVLGLRKSSATVADRVVIALLTADPRVSRLSDGRWSLTATPSGSPLIKDCTFAVVDVETTGAGPARGDRITEIAVVVVKDGEWELTFDSMVNPEHPISWKATEITGITDGDVANQPVFGEVADIVAGELAGRVFVAHNVSFDWRFVSSELRRARDITIDGPKLCTAKLARGVVPGLKSRGLDSLTRYFGVEIENRHRAGGDAIATAKILIKMIALAEENGARTLEDLLRIKKKKKKTKKTSMPTSVDEI
jgi:DNA polymerase-3 subunit epsilon